jgi:cytoskeletal protein CcmA (bactofilin family)
LHSQITAREVVVNGNVTGDLHARERIEIKKTGSVVGNMTTARIVIEEGAYFKGSVEIAKRPEKEKAEKGVSEPASVTERELAAMPV